MDRVLDGEQQRALLSTSDEQRRRHLARLRRERLATYAVLLAASIFAPAGYWVLQATERRPELLFWRNVGLDLTLAFAFAVVLVVAAVRTLRRLAATMQPVRAAIAAIVVATIGFALWALMMLIWLVATGLKGGIGPVH